MPPAVALPKMHMTKAENGRVDGLRARGKSPMETLALINRSRSIRGIAPVSQTAMYDYFAGSTDPT